MTNQESQGNLISGQNVQTTVSPWVKFLGIFLFGLCLGTLVPIGIKFLGFSADSKTKIATNLRNSSSLEHRIKAKVKKSDISLFDFGAESETPKNLATKTSKNLKSEIKIVPTDVTKYPEARFATKIIEKKKKLSVSLAARATNLELPSSAIQNPKNLTLTNKDPAQLQAKNTSKKSEILNESKTLNQPSVAIEEVPNFLTAQQVQKIMQARAPVAIERKLNPKVRLVSLPSARGNSNPIAAQVDVLKIDPRSDGKTYAMTLNNVSYSKGTLANCIRHCALLAMDASGNPIRAVFEGPSFAQSLLEHNGTINISGQPKLVKNQQILFVENISFNLSTSAQNPPAKLLKTRQAAAVPLSEPTSGFTEIPSDADDLKPGTIIRNRNQIPTDADEGIPIPAN